jgi:hypothetical protein
MPPRDHDPELAHPEVAGWVLGILDPADADRFAVHLRSCPDCQAAVAELGGAGRLLRTAAPAAQPPDRLQARTLDAVAKAAAAAGTDGRRGRWRARSTRMLALAAALVIAAAISVGLLVSRPAPAQSYTVVLHPQPGSPAAAASGRAVATQAGGGWSVQLTVAGLPDLGPGRFYECWWAGPGNRPGHPVLVSAGTFTVDRSGTATAQMWTAANPGTFQHMQITAQSLPNSSQHGQIILTGTASN